VSEKTTASVAEEVTAGERRPSPVAEAPTTRAGTFLMLAAWLLFVEGLHAILAMLEDVMDLGSAWPAWAYVGVAAVSFAGGGLLYTSKRWAYLVAAGAAVVAGFVFFPVAVGGFAVFALVELALLVLGFRAAGEHEAIQLASARVPWRVKVGVVQAVIAIALIRVFLSLDFDLEWIRDHAWNVIRSGLKLTLLISIGAIILAIILALLGALARLSKNPVAFGVAGFYTSFFRGTPLIVQLFLVYFGLAEIGVRMRGTSLETLGEVMTLGSLVAAVLAIGMNYGAYMTEIFRAGIQSVGHGQIEAADALGMNYVQKMRRIVLPQAVRVIIPPTGNEFIAMTKDSALAYTIGVLELFRLADLAGREAFRSLEAYLLVAGVYWALTGILTFFQVRLERKMGKGYVRTGTAGTQRTARRRAWLPGSAAGGTGGGGAMVSVPEVGEAPTPAEEEADDRAGS
jgi:polar amino acid transport system permease protein